MDPRTQLDHVVFQLTPTRTRCDLVAVSVAGSRDKIASGLVNPFLSHLQFARDQIPKGGYSFDLRPTGDAAPWFTRGTLERFVRFVATPEVLERVVTIETEIVQIEEAVDRAHESNPEGPGENSKSRLLLVLENRKKMLQKEQGMAYARASIAGYEKRHIDDLVSFADAFGAFRLREACISFKELCMEKEKDKLWVEELAALAASGQSQLSCVQSSGIVLTSENDANIPPVKTNLPSDGQKEQNGAAVDMQGMNSMPWSNQVPNGWLNHPPPEYMYAFRGPAAPNAISFQGYPFPGMQFMPPYSAHSANSHPNVGNEEPNNGSGKNPRSSSRDIHLDHEHSESGSETDEEESSGKNQKQKRSNKKSSRTVVIRNINYITPKGRYAENDESDESSVDDELVDEDDLRRKVEDIVGSFEKHQNSNRRHHKHKGGRRNHVNENGSGDVVDRSADDVVEDKRNNEHWDAFKDILMKDESSSQELDRKRTFSGEGNKQQRLDIVDEYCTVKGNTLSTTLALDGLNLDEELVKGVKPKTATADPIIMNGRDVILEGGSHVENFECDDNYCHMIKKTQNCNEEFMLSHREGSEISRPDEFSNSIDASATLKSHGVDDWLVVSEYERKAGGKTEEFSAIPADDILKSEGYNNPQKEKQIEIENNAFDDSVVAASRAPMDEQHFSLLETDISIISDLHFDAASHNPSNRQKLDHGSAFHEPGDLQMVLGRDSEVGNVTAVWTSEVEDYDPDINYTNIIEKKNIIEPVENVNDKLPTNSSGGKGKSLNAKPKDDDKKYKSVRGSLTKSRLDVLARSKRAPVMNKEAIQMSKSEKEEANRKRIEALEIERQKRISQRSASSSSLLSAKPSKAGNKASAGTLGQQKINMSHQNKQNGLSHPTKLQQPRNTIRKI